jgi:hypothetical protein
VNARRFVVALAVLAGPAVGLAPAGSQPDQHPVTKERMVAIFEALATALNLSLYDTPLPEPENREMIQEALASLAENAVGIDTHGGGLNPGFGFLQNSLARDANEAILRYRQGQYDGARFILDQLVEKCVACHTKLPDGNGFDLGRRFVERTRIEQLPREQRLRLLVATRQFEPALDEYEVRFKSRRENAQDIAAGNALCEYLKLSLRVRGDHRRAAATLTTFRKRRDVGERLGAQLDEWIRVVAATGATPPAGTELAAARELVREARRRNDFPADHKGTAHFVVASGLLQRFLERRPHDAAELSEAYYLLGVCESSTERSPWASETEFYLESAVRAAPSTPHAQLAFDFLEAYVAAEYSGSSGVVVPEEVTARLDELRGLIEDSRSR